MFRPPCLSLFLFCRLLRPVVSVLDGDTIQVLHNQHLERIRLSGFDCSEKGQAFGKKDKQAASELVFGKEVALQIYGLDKYKRTIADVLLPDGTNVNHTLVKAAGAGGIADMRLGIRVPKGLERDAREARKGLWADPQSVPPWEWRKMNR